MGYITEKCNSLEEALSKWEDIGFKQCRNKKGDKFNHLTIEYRTNNNGRHTLVVCQCDCSDHNYIRVRLDHLKNGHTKSCGCENIKQITQLGKDSALDLTGEKFGRLTAIKLAEEKNKNRTRGSLYWECLCECGNTHIVNISNLRSGHTTSCPKCNVKSIGEEKIIKILKDNDILFESQKTFNTCIFPENKYHAYFDFYINNSYLIEYDGEQHFKYRENQQIHWNNKENYEKTMKRDKFKNQWCKDNDIPLIRIPYTHLKNICLEDLLLETTKFRIV